MLNSVWRRIVIKVGSALISPDAKGCSTRYLLAIARFINECRQQGVEVVLVSSGSVAAGRNALRHGFSGQCRKIEQGKCARNPAIRRTAGIRRRR